MFDLAFVLPRRPDAGGVDRLRGGIRASTAAAVRDLAELNDCALAAPERWIGCCLVGAAEAVTGGAARYRGLRRVERSATEAAHRCDLLLPTCTQKQPGQNRPSSGILGFAARSADFQPVHTFCGITLLHDVCWPLLALDISTVREDTTGTNRAHDVRGASAGNACCRPARPGRFTACAEHLADQCCNSRR